MEEVDSILLVQLSRLRASAGPAGQPYALALADTFRDEGAGEEGSDEGEEGEGGAVQGLEDLTANHVYACVLLCLAAAGDGDADAAGGNALQPFAAALPRGMGARVNAASELVALCLALGYPDEELSYYNVLSPAPATLRRWLMWAVERAVAKQKGGAAKGGAAGASGSGSSSASAAAAAAAGGAGGTGGGARGAAASAEQRSEEEEREATDAAVQRRLAEQSREAWAPLVALRGVAAVALQKETADAAAGKSAAGKTSAVDRAWFVRDVHGFTVGSPVRLCPPPGSPQLQAVPGLEAYARSAALAPVARQPAPAAEARLPAALFEHSVSETAAARERAEEWATHGLAGGFATEAAYRERKRAALARSLAATVRRASAAAGASSGSHLASSGVDALAARAAADAAARLASQFSRKVEYTTEATGEGGGTAASELTEEEVAEQRAAQLQELADKLAALKDQADQARARGEEGTARLRQLQDTARQEEEKTPDLERDYKTKKATMDLLPEAEENAAQLRALATAAKGKIMELAQEWEVHRTKLVAEYRQLRAAWLSARGDTAVLLGRIREMRQEMTARAAEIQAKDAQYRELVGHYRELAQRRDRTRGYFTDRILDIVGSVKKQKADIDTILQDTRKLQKEINSISDTLNRTFHVTDELIFADAQKAEHGRNSSEQALGKDATVAYKHVAQLNEAFKQLVHTAEKHGRCVNATAKLEAQIQAVSEKTAALSLDDVKRDLEEMRTENKGLEQRVTEAKLGI